MSQFMLTLSVSRTFPCLQHERVFLLLITLSHLQVANYEPAFLKIEKTDSPVTLKVLKIL